MFPLFKTFSSLSKANLYSIIFACATLAILSVGVIVALITSMTAYFTHFETAWISSLINWSTGIITSIGGWFVLPAFMVLFAGIFQEKTIHRVERAFYPEVTRETPPEFWPDIWHDIIFTLKAIFLNILILPLYFFGIGFLLSILLNSYLLGREFFESAAGYHIGKPAARKLLRKNKEIIYGGGFIIVLMTLIPILNLFMPILAIVWMVHVYHKLTSPKS